MQGLWHYSISHILNVTSCSQPSFLWHAHIISSKVSGLNQISKLWTRNSQNKVECMASWANSADMRKVNKTVNWVST
jgi:hypothetical protein